MVKSRRSTSCSGLVSKWTALRAAAIGVVEVAAKGGNFDLGTGLMDKNHAEMSAYLPGVGEKTQDFGGKGGSGDIEILWLAAQQQIAHAATHQPRGVAVRAQLSNY